MKYLPLLVLGLLATPAFADDVSLKAGPLPDETAVVGNTVVDLVCTVQSDASLSGCRVSEGARRVSAQDRDTALDMVNGKGHMAGHVQAGSTVHLKITIDDATRRRPTPFLFAQ